MKKKPRKSNSVFSKWMKNYVERKHPALLFIGNPDFYFRLAKCEQRRCNEMAREVVSCVFEHDRKKLSAKFRSHLDDLALSTLSKIFPPLEWKGKVYSGKWSSMEDSQTQFHEFEQIFPDQKGKWSTQCCFSDIGKPIDA